MSYCLIDKRVPSKLKQALLLILTLLHLILFLPNPRLPLLTHKNLLLFG